MLYKVTNIRKKIAMNVCSPSSVDPGWCIYIYTILTLEMKMSNFSYCILNFLLYTLFPLIVLCHINIIKFET